MLHDKKSPPVRVGIIGATGYTALELLKLLNNHPQVEVTKLTSRDQDSPHISEVHPALRGQLDLCLVPLDLADFSKHVDCAFCCLPHAASAEVVSQLLEQQVRVVDFSADYRLDNVQLFEETYQVKHPDATRLGDVPYGIPEFFRDSIRDANLVANPGCFPTSVLLPLVPLLQSGKIQANPIIVDSKTGVSGAGRKPNLKFHFPECNESVAAYGVGTHRHKPEIDNLVVRTTGKPIDCIFTPHLIPMDRGILSTIYLQATPSNSAEDILQELEHFYADEPFVRVTQQLPATRDVSGTNFCDISVRQSGSMILIISVIDNLIKGASGAAVQNFNLMFGFDETTALGIKRT